MTKPSPASDRLTRFERGIVFRVARGYFLAMALLAVAMFIGGAVIGARGLADPEIPAPPQPATPPPRKPLTLEALQAELRRQSARAAAVGSTIELKKEPASATPTLSGRATIEDEWEMAAKRLRAVFPDPPYTWDNEMEEVCEVPTAFGCLRVGTRIKRFGVAGALTKLLEELNRTEALELIEVLVPLLAAAPVEQRLELVRPILEAERAARVDHEAALARHDAKLKVLKEQHDTAVLLSRAKHAEWRETGVYGLLIGFALLIIVSLFLAFLSMERHTRVLEKLVSEEPLQRKA
jgi:hypothetical protein